MFYILSEKFYLPVFARIVTYFANIPFFIYTFLLNCLHNGLCAGYTWHKTVR